MEIFRYIDEKTWNWNKTVSFLSPCGKTEQIDLLIRGGVGGGGGGDTQQIVYVEALPRG